MSATADDIARLRATILKYVCPGRAWDDTNPIYRAFEAVGIEGFLYDFIPFPERFIEGLELYD